MTKVNQQTRTAIQKLDTTASKLIAVQCSKDNVISVSINGTSAADIPVLLGAALARAYDTFTDEQKSEITFEYYIHLLKVGALNYHKQLEKSK